MKSRKKIMVKQKLMTINSVSRITTIRIKLVRSTQLWTTAINLSFMMTPPMVQEALRKIVIETTTIGENGAERKILTCMIRRDSHLHRRVSKKKSAKEATSGKEREKTKREREREKGREPEKEPRKKSGKEKERERKQKVEEDRTTDHVHHLQDSQRKGKEIETGKISKILELENVIAIVKEIDVKEIAVILTDRHGGLADKLKVKFNV